MDFHTLAKPVLYYVTFGTVLVLFCSALATLVWVLMKLRRLVVRGLGGSLDEQSVPVPGRQETTKRSHARLVPKADAAGG